jgi:hypothetical protein
MDDSTRSSTGGDDIGAQADSKTAPGLPRWVNVSVVIAAVLVLLVVVVILTQITGVGGLHEFMRNLHSGGH